MEPVTLGICSVPIRRRRISLVWRFFLLFNRGGLASGYCAITSFLQVRCVEPSTLLTDVETNGFKMKSHQLPLNSSMLFNPFQWTALTCLRRNAVRWFGVARTSPLTAFDMWYFPLCAGPLHGPYLFLSLIVDQVTYLTFLEHKPDTILGSYQPTL